MNTTLGRYEIIREIARSNCVVFEGWDPLMDRRVALKELIVPDDITDHEKEILVDRFSIEAKAVSQLHHPSIIEIYDFGTDAERVFQVLEYIDAPTLSSVLRSGPIEPDKVDQWIPELLDALGYAHKQGIIHRDVKPGNIFVQGSQVRLADFGIAKVSRYDGRTSVGTVLGTLGYMSPEALRGEQPSPEFDLWGVGVILYECLMGTKPFQSDSIVGLIQAISENPLDLPADLSQKYRPILESALNIERLRRYPDAEAFKEAILKASSAAHPLSAPIPSPQPAASPISVTPLFQIPINTPSAPVQPPPPPPPPPVQGYFANLGNQNQPDYGGQSGGSNWDPNFGYVPPSFRTQGSSGGDRHRGRRHVLLDLFPHPVECDDPTTTA